MTRKTAQTATSTAANAAKTGPTSTHGGGVAFVGTGPGDPELLTVRALRLIEEADVLITETLWNFGVGEGMDDLRPFDPHAFENALAEAVVGRAKRRDRVDEFVVMHPGGDLLGMILLGIGGQTALLSRNRAEEFARIGEVPGNVGGHCASLSTSHDELDHGLDRREFVDLRHQIRSLDRIEGAIERPHLGAVLAAPDALEQVDRQVELGMKGFKWYTAEWRENTATAPVNMNTTVATMVAPALT